MNDEVNRYRNQWDNEKPDNLASIMPLMIFRVVWKDQSGQYFELWTHSKAEALEKKKSVDHSSEKFLYVNFEAWYAYRSMEHEAKFGRNGRALDWWEPKK